MGLTIDGIKLSDLGVKVLATSKFQMVPPTRDRLLTIPGRHGAYDFGTDFEPRTFDLDCIIVGQANEIDFQQKVRQLAKMFTDGYGRPKEVRLIFDHEPDKFYNVRLTGAVSLERMARLGRFTMTLRANDPAAKFILLTDEYEMLSDVPMLSDITIDAVYTHTVTGTQTVNIINDGTISVRPNVIITGSASSVTVSNADTNTSFTVVDTANKTTQVDGGKYVVKVDGVSTLQVMTGDFIELLPGYNEVTISAADNNATVTFSFYNQYI